MPESKVLGQNYPRVDAADKVSGRSQYASDVYLPGMLMCKVLQSPKPHARILHIDTSRAQSLPGVRAVITVRDVPDARFGNGAVKDQRLFALDKVRYIGEPVAAVAAVDEITALEALDLIDVTYEDLPAVTDPIAALRPDAPLVHEDLPSYEGYKPNMRGNICTVLDADRGDIAAAFAQADHVFEETFRSQGINQGYLEAISIFDMRAHLGAGVQSGVSHTLGPYNIPNYRMRSYAVYTNKIWAGSYRASGVADVTFAVESHTDIIARRLGLDPWEFRKQNAFHEGDLALQGGKIPRNGLHETMEAVKQHLGWPRASKAGTGVGLAMCQWRSGSGPSTASISIHEDGTVSVLTGSVDISGTDTVFAQITAETLGVNMDDVVIARRDTDLAPFTGPSGGSRIIYSQGKAVQMAAADARDKLIALAAEHLDVQPGMLTCANGRVFVTETPERGYTLGQLARLSLTSASGPIMGTAS